MQNINILNNLNADNFTFGTLLVNRLPGFTGDVTRIAGNNVLSLSNSDVVKPGSINGAFLVPSEVDIPLLP